MTSTKLQADDSLSSTSPSPIGAIGTRNDTLFRLACSLVRNGLPHEAILQSVRAHNASFPSPLDDAEVLSVVKSAMRYDASPAHTELDVAKALTQKFKGKFKYSPMYGWLAFDGTRWKRDPEGSHVQEAAKRLVDEIRHRIEANPGLKEKERESLLASANRLRRAGAVKGIKQLSASAPELLDEEPWQEAEWLLNLSNGTLDLKTMELRPHDPADRLMKVLPYAYDPNATCPLFDKVLSEVLDPETGHLILQLYGYALKGTGEQQLMAFLTGVGRNGKSTIMQAVANVFCEYAVTADPAVFLKSANKQSNNNEVAEMAGARLISVPETNSGAPLDSALVKRMTGGEQLYARLLYRNGFQFQNKALMIMGTNMLPVFEGSDLGITRRILPIVFDKIIDEQNVDPDLPAKLEQEVPGILNRLIEGLKSYESNNRRLSISPRVEEARKAAIREANQVLQFVEHFCVLGANLTTKSGPLLHGYRNWALNEGIRPMSSPAFVQALQRTYPEIQRGRNASGQFWVGIGMKPTF